MNPLLRPLLTSALLFVIIFPAASALAGDHSPTDMAIGKSVTLEQPAGVAPDDDWNFEFRPFAWTISMQGDVGAAGFLAPVDISFGDIVDSLNFSAAASLLARKDRWSIYLEGLYLEAGPDIPSPPSGRFSIDGLTIEMALATGVISYRVMEWDKGFLDVGAGARYTYLANELRLSLGPTAGPIARTASSSKGYVDPIVGFRVKQDLNEKIYLNFAADIGGFGVSSDLLWDLMGGVGYRVRDNLAVEFYYRYEEIDYDRGPVLDVALNGLFLGFAFSF